MCRQRLGIMVASLVGILSAFLAWISFGGFVKTGTEGDGMITLILFAVCLVLVVLKDRGDRLPTPLMTVVVILGLLSAAIALINILDVSKLGADMVGVGMWLTLASGVAVAALAVIFRGSKE